jgi:hypothetical protein
MTAMALATRNTRPRIVPTVDSFFVITSSIFEL